MSKKVIVGIGEILWDMLPSGKADVVDTVGAGDAFTAAFVVSFLRGDSLAEAQRQASDTAAYVCFRKGAMPE